MEEESIRARAHGPSKDERSAERLGEALRDLGFQVEGVSRLGVGFRGPRGLFERVFGAGVARSGRGWTFVGEVRLPAALAAEDAVVYLPDPPELI
jgi:hypothetical protein